MSGFGIPEGWTSEGLDGDYSLIRSATGLMVTVDLKRRGFRSGCSTTGPMTSTRKYTGRNWNVSLVLDAVEWLRNLEATPLAPARKRRAR